MIVSHSNCIFRYLLFIGALNLLGSQAKAATKTEKREPLPQESSVLLTPETWNKRPVMRLRLRGEEARQICAFLGVDLDDKPAGSIFAVGPSKKAKPRMSCLTTSASGPERFAFGFILDKEGQTYDLEASGYQ